jgi:pimeloyl-ACP methyl ester carboxylesterase
MRSWVLSLLATGVLCAQPYQPTPDELNQVRARLADLTDRPHRLESRPDALRADVEVYAKAAQWILRYPEEFYAKAYLANTLKDLDHGIARARELEAGNPSWPARKGRLVRAYRSAVDGSIQPYALIIPESYDGHRAVRLDLVLHGRGATLNEVSFIAAHESETPAPAGQDFITLEVFGRGNNAYRWAGEADVFEALDAVQKHYRIDPDRVVLRGFSMGGAGAWHLGLHHPARWAAMEAGAGFTETKRYAKLAEIPPYQEATLHIYDAVDYSLNAQDLPVVGYGGEIDPQLQASTNIREDLARLGFHFRHEGLDWFATDLQALFLVGPQTAHKFHPESKKVSDEFLNRAAARGRAAHPEHFHFVTYTPRYNGWPWVNVSGLERQYERAELDVKHSAAATAITTTNIASLEITQPGEVTLDGKRFPAGPMAFEKVRGAWRASQPGGTSLRKRHGLEGPIDDAFLEPFVCVRPTGTPMSPAAGDYAKRALGQFARNFAKYFRGDIRTIDDRSLTESDIAGSNLILFGDPAGNAVIGRILKKLPLRWTAQTVKLGGKEFSASDHVPVLIYPNPLNPKKYVVINSGHTFGEADLKGTNALLYPRLGDYAVLNLDGTVATAGLFDESWQIP